MLGTIVHVCGLVCAAVRVSTKYSSRFVPAAMNNHGVRNFASRFMCHFWIPSHNGMEYLEQEFLHFAFTAFLFYMSKYLAMLLQKLVI